MKTLILVLSLSLAAVAARADSVTDYVSQLHRFGFDAAVLIVEHGKPTVRIGAERPYYVASVTKTFTAAAITVLARNGRLALNDSITRFLTNVPEDKRAITIDQLINHTSGLPHEYGGEEAITRDEAVRTVLAETLLGVPGAKRSYSNDGYTLLAAIVEIASGEPFDRFVARELFQPAGLKHAAFTGACPKAIARRVAPGDSVAPCGQRAAIAFRGPTGIIADADDLAAWVDALMRRKIFGEPKGLEELGALIGHGGDDDAVGHSAVVGYDRANDRTIVVASNAAHWADMSPAWMMAQRVVALLGERPAIAKASIETDSHGRKWIAVEGQERIDAVVGPVARAAEHNAFAGRAVASLRDGNDADVDALLGKRGDYIRRWWKRSGARGATVLGTAPAWWDTGGGSATFLRLDTEKGSVIARMEWDENGAFRALGGAAIPAPLLLAVQGGEAFDPANAVRVRLTPP
jgi:CubicO group peptidase (beta-lactamase class C family)